MLRSTTYFGQRELAQSLRHYGQLLLAQNRNAMMYNGKDLRGEFE
jgi:hypothetical protein